MRRLLPFLLMVACGPGTVSSEPGSLFEAVPGATAARWSLLLGGERVDEARTLVITGDGGVLVGGRTRSFGAEAVDAWLWKTDADGALSWQIRFGGSENDVVRVVVGTPDGGGFVAVETWSLGKGDLWLLRVDRDGGIEWQRSYGTSGYDVPTAMVEKGGHVLVAGYTETHHNRDDFWLLEVDEQGEVVWQRTLGGSGDDWATALVGLRDGFAVTGLTHSFGAGAQDTWVVKLDDAGSIVWQTVVGSPGREQPAAIAELASGNLLVAVSSWPVASGEGCYGTFECADVELIELDGTDGTVVRAARLHSAGFEEPTALLAGIEGVVVAGYTTTLDGDSEVWVAELDAELKPGRQVEVGGSRDEMAHALARADDGSLFVAAHTVSAGAGQSDAWVMTLDTDTSTDSLTHTEISPVWSATDAGGVAGVAVAAVVEVVPAPTEGVLSSFADRGPPTPAVQLRVSMESEEAVAATGARLEVTGSAGVVFEPGVSGDGMRFPEPADGSATLELPVEAFDLADLDNDGGAFDFWLRFDTDPHAYVGNKFIVWGGPFGDAWSLEIYGSNPFLAAEVHDRNRVEQSSDYRFLSYSGTWNAWEEWRADEWHRITITWKRNVGEGNAELHFFIDGEQAGCPQHQCNDYFGFLPDPGAMTGLALGAFSGGYAIAHSLDEITIAEAWE